MSKIIATDLDGTLFYPKDSTNLIHANNLYFLQSFIDRGGSVILVTGRSLDFGYKVINKINRECSIIAFNGGCIYHNKEIVRQVTIDNSRAKEIVKWAHDRYNNSGVFLMTENGIFFHIKYKSKLIRWGFKLYYNTQKAYAEKHDYEESAYDREIEHGRIFKLNLYFGLGKRCKEKARAVTDIIQKEFPDETFAWSENVIEVTGKNTGKAKALVDFCKDFQINPKDVYVVGDSGNDVSMFEAFYDNSFCMSHAPDSVKDKAKFSLSNFEDLSRYIYEK